MLYLFLVNLTILLCYALYRIFFKKLTFFQWNRVYLLSSLVLSLVIPIGVFIDLSSNTLIEESLPTIDLTPVFTEKVMVVTENEVPLSIGDVLSYCYWGVTSLMLVWLLGRLLYAMLMVRKGKLERSYTFFNRIGIAKRAQNIPAISDHENVHARQGHSYDLLFVELFKAFNWFNPALYYYLKELKFQHECIADESTSLDSVSYAQLLVAQAMHTDSHVFLQEFSNHSLLKQRIQMLFKDKSKKKYKYLYFSAAPVLLLAVISTLVFNTSKAKSLVQDIESSVNQKNLTLAAAENLVSSHVNVEGVDRSKRPEPAVGMTQFMADFSDAYVAPRKITNRDKDPYMAVAFAVHKSGALSDFRLAEGDLGAAFFDEAVRLIKKATWNAAVDSSGAKVDGVGIVMFKFGADGKIRKNYTRIDVLPEPAGGLKAWKRYVGSNYLFPDAFVKAKEKGEFTLSFRVGKTGEIESISVKKETAPNLAKSAIQVIKKFGAWRPGIFEGEQVAYRVDLSCQLDAGYGYGVIHMGDVKIVRIDED